MNQLGLRHSIGVRDIYIRENIYDIVTEKKTPDKRYAELRHAINYDH